MDKEEKLEMFRLVWLARALVKKKRIKLLELKLAVGIGRELGRAERKKERKQR